MSSELQPNAGNVSVDERVCGVIATQLRKSRDLVSAGARLADDLGADSLDTVEIVMAMETEFKLDLMATKVRVETVQDVIDYIKNAMGLGEDRPTVTALPAPEEPSPIQ